MDTLEKVGAKINPNLEQLILPYLTSKDSQFHGVKIITPNYSTLSAHSCVHEISLTARLSR